MKNVIFTIIFTALALSLHAQGFATIGLSFVPRSDAKQVENTSVFTEQPTKSQQLFSHVTATYGGGYTTHFKKKSALSLVTFEGLIYRPFSSRDGVPFFGQVRVGKGMKLNCRSRSCFDMISLVAGYSVTNEPTNQENRMGHGATFGVSYLSDLGGDFMIRYDLTYSNHYLTPTIGLVLSGDVFKR